MKKFNFRLSGFLRIKEFEEKNAWNEVLQQENRVSSIKSRMNTLHESIHENRTRLSQSQASQNPMAQWQWAEESIEGQKAQIAILEKEYQLELKTLEKLVARHREINKEAKIISNYKDRKKEEFIEDKSKLEELQRNEYATLSHMRRMK